jgi:hypothetical protein
LAKLLLVGLGELGKHILEFLARLPNSLDVVAADVDARKGVLLVNNALMGAMAQHLAPRLEFAKLDLNDEEQTIDLLTKTRPDMIINSTVLQTWHRIRRLPRLQYERLSSATLGAWLPMQLTLTQKLMKSVKKSGLQIHVVNTSLSDIVNPVLGRIGLAPTVGIGNIDLIVQGVKMIVSQKLNVSINAVSVFMLAHHVHWVYPREAGYEKGAPHFIKILVGDKNVTDSFDKDKLLIDAVKLYPPGTEFTSASASSAIKIGLSILEDRGILTHAPGPEGLPGGYPVYLDRSGAKAYVPEDLSRREAIEINEKAQAYDGIEKIEDDGTVVFVERSAKIMREMLGYDCRRMRPEESEQRAKELLELYREFEAKYVS